MLIVGVGNRLRSDDGVGPRVLELLADVEGLALREAHGLMPELAVELAQHESVVFVDADPEAKSVRLERFASGAAPSLGHVFGAGALVALATELYGFAGEVHLCRVPARSFDHGETLSSEAERAAEQAAASIRALCDQTWTSSSAWTS